MRLRPPAPVPLPGRVTDGQAERQAAPRGGTGVLRLLLVASVLGPACILAAGGWLAYRSQMQAAHGELLRTADVTYENATKIFETSALLLRQMETLLEGLDDAAIRADQAEVATRLAALDQGLPQLNNLLVIGVDGEVLATARQGVSGAPVNVADRDYFRETRAGDGLIVSQTDIGRVGGRPFFDVLRARRTTDGVFAGVIAVSMSPAYFNDAFHRIAAAVDVSRSISITMRRSDDALLAGSGTGTPSTATHLSQALRRAVDDSPTSGFVTMNADNERPDRLVAWRKLNTLPLTVFASLPRPAVMQRWRVVMATHLAIGLPATIALFTITLIAMRRTRAAEEAADRTLTEVRRREAAERAAREAQKMEAIGKLTGGVAHDFNNLLAVIMGNAELAMGRQPEAAAKLLDSVVQAARRGEQLTRQLLAFARNRPEAPRLLDLRREMPRIMEMLRPGLRANVAVRMMLPETVWPVMADPAELEIALLNLAMNARDAMPRGGELTVGVVNLQADALGAYATTGIKGEHVAMTVSDTGQGMSDAVIRRAFEPFFTTKDVGRGTGLGLSQVYGFARQSGGVAHIASTLGVGTAVTILFPRAAAATAPALPAVEPMPDRVAPRRVLLVEDNHEVADVIVALLGRLGCTVEAAERAGDALARLHGGLRTDFILSDIVMPDGMSGIDLARDVRRFWPELPIILMTGYAERLDRIPAGVSVLQKPLRLADLARVLGQVDTVAAK